MKDMRLSRVAMKWSGFRYDALVFNYCLSCFLHISSFRSNVMNLWEGHLLDESFSNTSTANFRLHSREYNMKDLFYEGPFGSFWALT
jgi:hypothetical protein